MQIGIEELEMNITEIVQRVYDEGEPIDITSQGEVIARLIPAEKQATNDEAIDRLFQEIDELADEVAASQSGTFSAVDLVREMRRE